MESKINVTVRIKPLSDIERANDKNHIWNQISENTIINVKTKEMFTFDNVFGERAHTQQIFDSQVKELVISAMQGFNVTAFAYGQTSSGKTYTMRGYNDDDPGLIPLSIRQVFDCISDDKDRKYDINVSYLEIYNETLNDLIEPNNKNLEIRESISKGIYINRLSECNVTTREQVLKYMWQGDDQRIIAETKLNEQSSRSHTVFRINITSRPINDESKVRVSQLNLVDLAGSEGASRTQADGLRLREGSNINRSLLALSNVINRLSSANGGKTFINFRDSKLTRILQTALGGNSKTAIICTMTQTLSNYQETLNTLHFGQKAKHVKTTVNVNEINQGLFNGQMGPEMEKAQKEILDLKAKLKEFETKVLEYQKSHIASNQGVEQMQIDQSNSRSSIGKDDFTVSFLKDQLRFMTEKQRKTDQELEEKEALIQKLEHEKREMQRQCENMEVENIKIAEKLKELLTMQMNQSTISHKSKKMGDNSELYRTPKVGKQQNKRVLEEDGIKCFDLERQSLIAGQNAAMDEFDLRESIGFSSKSMISKKSNSITMTKIQAPSVPSQEISELTEQIVILEELEKLRHDNEDMQMLIEKLEHEKLTLTASQDNNHALKEELDMMKEELLFQGEELAKYQRHSTSLADELQFYKAQNNDLLRRLDDCEKTLLSSSDNENNSSVIIYQENQKETQKLIKDENAALKLTIQKLKEDVKQLEMVNSRSESVRAEIEYTSRAAEYNVEILKNQIENLNNEVALMKKQNDKQKKSIEIMRQTNDRMSQDLEHYKKLSLNHSKKTMIQSSTPQQQQAFTPIAQGKMGAMTPLDQSIIKERDSFPPVSQMTLFLPQHQSMPFSQQNECVVETTLNMQIVMPHILTVDQEAQVTLLDINKMNELDAQILYLQTEVEDKQRKIEELDRQLASAQQQMAQANAKGTNESEIVKNIRYDNQILMSKLSEYKKAEKNVKDLVNDYEQMKLKYFNVLTENSAQKTHIQELIQAKLDSEIALKDLNDEKQQYVNDMYALRMDVTKRIDELAKKNAQVMHLQEEIGNAHKKVIETVKKDKEIADLQNVIDSFFGFFGLIDKHLKTLVKMLRELISKCDDPKIIEHNQKQIKSIESLLEEVKLSLSAHGGTAIMGDAANRLIESFFQLSNDSLREVQNQSLIVANPNNETSSSIPAQIEAKSTQLLGKRRKINEDGEFKIIVGGEENNAPPSTLTSAAKKVMIENPYDSAEDTGTVLTKKSTIPTAAQMSVGKKTQKKITDKNQMTAQKNFMSETPRRSERGAPLTTSKGVQSSGK